MSLWMVGPPDSKKEKKMSELAGLCFLIKECGLPAKLTHFSSFFRICGGRGLLLALVISFLEGLISSMVNITVEAPPEGPAFQEKT